MSNPIANQPTSHQSVNEQSETSNLAIAQLKKLRQIAFTRETALTFTQSIYLLFTLLKEALVFLWFALCYGLIAFNWLATKALHSGQRAKNWFSALSETKRDKSTAEVVAETGKLIVMGSKAAIAYIMTQAKKQVGLLNKE
ncbi:hypothetical protein [Phormidesmis priestleyi]